MAVSSLYHEDKHRVLGVFSDLAKRSSADNRLQSDSEPCSANLKSK